MVPSVFVVNSLADNTAPDGVLTLREACDIANAGTLDIDHVLSRAERAQILWDSAGSNIIRFDPRLTREGPATIRLSLTGDRSEGNSALVVSRGLTIEGPTGPSGITLAGPGQGGDRRLFLVSSTGDLTVRDLALSRGATDGSGGAIYVEGGGAARLARCSLTGNFAVSRGGALYNEFGTVTLTDCTVSGNSALGEGGGIANFGTLALAGTTLARNHADRGGGLANGHGTATLTGCLLVGNRAADAGGGFFNAGALYGEYAFFQSGMTLTDSRIAGNSAGRGGGGFNAGPITLVACTITGNSATEGGGLDNGSLSNLVDPTFFRVGEATLSKCTVSGNSAARGGGLFNAERLTLTDSTVSGNRAIQGGGLFIASDVDLPPFSDGGGSTVTLIDSTLWGNRAHQGGGVYNDLGTATLVDSTVWGNAATAAGGGIVNNSLLALTNTTLAANSAPKGGGLDNELGWARLLSSTISRNTAATGGGLYNGLGAATLISTIVAGNRHRATASDIAATIPVDVAHSSSNLIGAGGSGGLVHGLRGNIVGAEARLAPLGDYGGPVKTMALLPGSPAIDAGTGTGADARGVAPVGRKDIGAFEGLGSRLSGVAGPHPAAPAADESTRPPLPASASGSGKMLEATQGMPSTSLGPTVLPADQTVYRLDAAHRLWERSPGTRWTVLEDGVLSFQKAPNGDLYVLSDHRELKQLKLGYLWTTLQAGVRSFTMDPQGTVYGLDDTGRVWMFRSLDRYYVLPPIPDGGPALALDPPDSAFIMRAIGIRVTRDNLDVPPSPSFPFEGELAIATGASLSARVSDPSSPFSGLRLLVEKVGEQVGPPRFFPTVGLAQLHHEHYKVAVYVDVVAPDQRASVDVRIIFIDKDHLHRYIPGPAKTPNMAGPAAGGLSAVGAEIRSAPASDQSTARAADGPGVGLPPDAVARSLTRGPDGTIYKLGGGESGIYWLGTDQLPLDLWRLSPGSSWRRVARAYSFAVAPDNTLYVLNADRRLQSLPAGSRRWSTLDTGVQSFGMAPDGTVYELSGAGELRRRLPGSGRWSTLDVGVRSFSMAPDGTVYELNGRRQLKRVDGRGHGSVVDTVVQSFSMTPDGTVYELDRLGHLKRIEKGGRRSVLDVGVQSFTMGTEGTVYVLDVRRRLKRMTARGHWTILDAGVTSFAVAPTNGDVYLLNDRHQLRRLKLGYSWTTLQDGVQSMGMDPDGTVYTVDGRNQLLVYRSGFDAYPVYDPITEALPPGPTGAVGWAATLNPPSLAEVLSTTHVVPASDAQVESGQLPLSSGRLATAAPRQGDGIPYVRDVRNVVTLIEKMPDSLDRVRVFPGVGPARLHPVEYRCTVFYTTTAGVNERRIAFIDKDEIRLYT